VEIYAWGDGGDWGQGEGGELNRFSSVLIPRLLPFTFEKDDQKSESPKLGSEAGIT
jgi:hypothetical protein